MPAPSINLNEYLIKSNAMHRACRNLVFTQHVPWWTFYFHALGEKRSCKMSLGLNVQTLTLVWICTIILLTKIITTIQCEQVCRALLSMGALKPKPPTTNILFNYVNKESVKWISFTILCWGLWRWSKEQHVTLRGTKTKSVNVTVYHSSLPYAGIYWQLAQVSNN